MPRFVIERDIPGVGSWSRDQLCAASQRSNEVLQAMSGHLQWVQSFVTGDKLYCVYGAPNEELIRVHAQRAGFPVDRISEVATIIDPTTAEPAATAISTA